MKLGDIFIKYNNMICTITICEIQKLQKKK